jgi:hypothetical protein
MQLDSFGTVTEFGVAIAGFSALAAALTHEPGTLTPLDRFRTVNLLMAALTPAFAATFPMIGEAFGASGAALWRGTSVGVSVAIVLSLVVSLRLVHSLSAVDRLGLSRPLWVLFLGVNALALAALLINASEVLGPAGPGPILASLVGLLFLGAVQLVRIVVVRTVEPEA